MKPEDMPQAMVISSPVREREETPLLADSQQPLLLWHKLALSAVLAIAAFFNFFALAKQDFFEYYYAAAIKSMLMSWHNFFFVSFDPAGFLALDKPPLGFWMQALSAKLFGFSVFSILLPEALAGVLAVALVFHLVRRVFGPLAGLIAALVLALSPINVVTNRNNLVDSLLVLTVLLAAWMMSKAAETGRLRWLCLCAVLLGLGFNIKYLQAYMLLPAFGLVYLLGAPARWRTKLCHLALALAVLLLVSLCWITIVDLTPASQRPYIDSIASNSELDLAFGYDGTFRLTAANAVVNNWAWEIGRPGIARFFEEPVAGQCSWLLPLALSGLLGLHINFLRSEAHDPHKGSRYISWRGLTQRQTCSGLPCGGRARFNRQQQALVLWGTWLLTMLVFFSDAHFFHLYYLSMLTPAIAALVGAGVVTMWRNYVHGGWRGWLLPSALLVTGAFQSYLLAPFPRWSSMGIVGACIIAEFVLVLVRWNFRPSLQRVAMITSALGLLSLLLAPTVWAATPLSREGRVFPIAGPSVRQTHIRPNLADPVLVDYLLAHKGKAQFLLATMNTEVAAPFILETGQAVMALGGYSGRNSFLTRDQLIQLIDHGTVRFFLLSPHGNQTVIWLITHCTAVPPAQWQSPTSANFPLDKLQLYDCRGVN